MKSPLFHSGEFVHAPQKSRRALDVTAPKKSVSAQTPSYSTRVTSERLPAAFKKRNFDGVQRGKQTLLAQLKERSPLDILRRLFRKGELYYRLLKRAVIRFTPDIAPHKMLYGSLTLGVVFGIVSMGFIEHFFGPGVFARSQDSAQTMVVPATEVVTAAPQESVNSEQAGYNSETDIFFEYFNEGTDAQYKETVKDMVNGYPIEKMLPYIFEQDRLTAAFLIGIAKKESNWGKRVPVLDDQDCFNYWGYRGVRRLMGTGGHTCFNSSKDAVETVAKRLNTLIHSEKLNTPEKMIIWKCGFSCSGHSRESVKKWISDVDMYFKQLSE